MSFLSKNSSIGAAFLLKSASSAKKYAKERISWAAESMGRIFKEERTAVSKRSNQFDISSSKSS